MKLKDIAEYCLHDTSYLCEGNLTQKQRYYWCINGGTYVISEVETYGNYCNNTGLTNILHLTKYNHWNIKDNNTIDRISLNLDNEITIFDRFILVHKTGNEVTDCERKIFVKQNYYLANGHSASSDHYTIGLFHTDPMGGMATNLRSVFKDLISPPIQSKPAELTLDEKVDDLINELMKENKVKAIKKLKRMLNERL